MLGWLIKYAHLTPLHSNTKDAARNLYGFTLWSTCSPKIKSLLGRSIFFNPEGQSSQTIQPTELEKRDHHPNLLCPGLKTLFFTFTSVQSKNELDLVLVSDLVSFFRKRSSQTVQPITIKKQHFCMLS